MVTRKLYKAWDSDNKTMVALKLVEVYGFAAASAWAGKHVAVPSMLVRYAFIAEWGNSAGTDTLRYRGPSPFLMALPVCMQHKLLDALTLVCLACAMYCL